MIYNFYIFDRHCNCVFYLEFQTRGSHTQSGGVKPSSGLEFFSWPSPDAVDTTISSSKVFASTYTPPNFSEPAFIERSKLVYGVVFSLKNFANKLAGPLDNLSDGFLSFRTHHYKLHYFETLTGLRLIITTDPQCPHLRNHLKSMFSTIYVEQVVKNPAAVSFKPEEGAQTTGHHWQFNNPMFSANVVKFLSQLPHFNS